MAASRAGWVASLRARDGRAGADFRRIAGVCVPIEDLAGSNRIVVRLRYRFIIIPLKKGSHFPQCN